MEFQQPSLSSVADFCPIDSLLKSDFYHNCRIQGCCCESFGFTIKMIHSYELNGLINGFLFGFIILSYELNQLIEGFIGYTN